jgi:hypothetical protein
MAVLILCKIASAANLTGHLARGRGAAKGIDDALLLILERWLPGLNIGVVILAVATTCVL